MVMPAGRPAIVRSSNLAAALVATALLVGCETLGLRKPPPVPAEPLQIEAGSLLTLRVPLAFAPDADVLYFQDSRLVSHAGIARDFPYCSLTPASAYTARVIQPGTLEVRSVEYDDKEIGSTGNENNVTRITLMSEPNQSGFTLSCQWPEGGPSRRFLTSEEIQGAIGAQFSMALAR